MTSAKKAKHRRKASSGKIVIAALPVLLVALCVGTGVFDTSSHRQHQPTLASQQSDQPWSTTMPAEVEGTVVTSIMTPNDSSTSSSSSSTSTAPHSSDKINASPSTSDDPTSSTADNSTSSTSSSTSSSSTTDTSTSITIFTTTMPAASSTTSTSYLIGPPTHTPPVGDTIIKVGP